MLSDIKIENQLYINNIYIYIYKYNIVKIAFLIVVNIYVTNMYVMNRVTDHNIHTIPTYMKETSRLHSSMEIGTSRSYTSHTSTHPNLPPHKVNISLMTNLVKNYGSKQSWKYVIWISRQLVGSRPLHCL